MTKSEALAELAELPEAPAVAVVRVQPGDVICIEFPGDISDETAHRLMTFTKEMWPNNKIAVVGNGGTFKVIKAVSS